MKKTRVISFSLYGDRPEFLQGAVENFELAQSLYPDWSCRFYFDATVPYSLVETLSNRDADMINVEDPWQGHYKHEFWRFLVAAEDDVEFFICRDVRSRLNPREKAAVDAWIASGKTYHLMRDMAERSHILSASCFGAKGGCIPNIAALIEGWGVYNDPDENADRFLANILIPLPGDHSLLHDSLSSNNAHKHAFPAHAPLSGISRVGEFVQPSALPDIWGNLGSALNSIASLQASQLKIEQENKELQQQLQKLQMRLETSKEKYVFEDTQARTSYEYKSQRPYLNERLERLFGYLGGLKEIHFPGIPPFAIYLQTQRDMGISPSIWTTGSFEKHETKLFKAALRPNDKFINVGANIGWYVLVAGKLLSAEGRVMALEPEPFNYDLLLRNIKNNTLTNVIPLDVAAGAEDGTQNIYCAPYNLGDHQMYKTKETRGSQEVQVKSLDSLIKEHNFKPDIIMMDTQGFEVHILEGLKNTLQQTSGNLRLFLEFWPQGIINSGKTLQPLLEAIKTYNWRVIQAAPSKDFAWGQEFSAEDLMRISEKQGAADEQFFTNLFMAPRADAVWEEFSKQNIFSKND